MKFSLTQEFLSFLKFNIAPTIRDGKRLEKDWINKLNAVAFEICVSSYIIIHNYAAFPRVNVIDARYFDSLNLLMISWFCFYKCSTVFSWKTICEMQTGQKKYCPIQFLCIEERIRMCRKCSSNCIQFREVRSRQAHINYMSLEHHSRECIVILPFRWQNWDW